MSSRSKWMILPAALALAAGACGDDPSMPGLNTRVTVRFAGEAGGAGMPSGPATSAFMAPLTISGTNGTLVIDEIRMIVAEFELDHADGAPCDSTAAHDDSCPDFEAPPSFVDLPLGTGSVTVATGRIPDGTYDALEFEVEDIDIDEAGEDAAEIAAVAARVRAAFPDWPEEATMVVTGSFTPTGGSAVPFTTYFDAEIKVELDLVPPLTIVDGTADRVLLVRLFPAEWFRASDGTVVDLSQWDFETHGEAADFEMDIEGSFGDAFTVDLDGADD